MILWIKVFEFYKKLPRIQLLILDGWGFFSFLGYLLRDQKMEENPFLFKFHSIHMEHTVLYNILKTKTKLLVFSRSLFFLEEVTRRNMFLQMVVIDHKKDIIEWFKRHLIGEQVNCVVSINNMSSNCRLTWKNKSSISNNFFLFSSKKINAKWDKENKIKT